jgi:uncharacterized protein (TIGR02246 family)
MATADPGPAPDGALPTPDEDDVLAAHAAWTAAIVANDAVRMADFVTADWVIVAADGVSPGSRLLDLVASGTVTHTAMQVLEPVRVRVLGDTALVTARMTNTAHVQGTAYDADEWTTDVMVRRGGRWRCALTHYTAAVGSDG